MTYEIIIFQGVTIIKNSAIGKVILMNRSLSWKFAFYYFLLDIFLNIINFMNMEQITILEFGICNFGIYNR